MATSLGNYYVQITANAEGISNSIKSSLGSGEQVGASYGSSISTGIGKGVKVAGGVLATLGATTVALTKKMFDGAKSTAEMGDQVDKMSQKIGISRNAYQEWSYVFDLCGTNVDNLQAGMKTMSSVVADAASGSKTAQAKIEALGLSVKDLNGLSQEEQLNLVISQLQGMESGAERTSAAVDILGRSATDMSALLNMSAEDTEKAKIAAHDYGMVMSNEAVANCAAFQDSLTTLNGAFTGFANSIFSEALPSMTTFVTGLSDLIAGNDGAMEEIQTGAQGMIEGITSMLPQLLTLVTTLATAVLQEAPTIIQALGDGIIQALPTLIPVVGDIVLKLVTTLTELLPQLLETGLLVIVELCNGIAQSLPTLIPTLVEVILNMVDILIDNVDLLIDASIALIIGLSEGLITAMPMLIDRLPEIVVKMVDALIKCSPQLLQAGVQLMIELIAGIVSCTIRVATAGVQLIGNLINKIKENKGNFKTIGADLIQGFLDGIRATWDRVVSWVRDACGRLTDTIKSVFDIHSPSKLFRDEIGINLAKGIGVGFTEGMDDVNSSIDSAIQTDFDVQSQITATQSHTMRGEVKSSSDIDFTTILNALGNLAEAIQNQSIVMDSGALVGSIAPAMDNELGRLSARSLRGAY